MREAPRDLPQHPHAVSPRTLQGGSVPCATPPTMPATQEIHLKVLRLLEENPDVTQRELAETLGVSLGKANYCLKALIDKGFIKARNFQNSKNKRAYIYRLTPSGLEAKAKISLRFLKRKMNEYELLRAEIEQLKSELGESSVSSTQSTDL